MRSPIHICRLNANCRKWGAPNRVSIQLFGRYFAVALNAESKFVGSYTPQTGWSPAVIKTSWTEYRKTKES